MPAYSGRVVSANKVQPNLKALFFVLYHSNAFWKLLRLGNSAWDFWGVNLCSGNFFGVLLKALGIILGFDFCPHLIIPVT